MGNNLSEERRAAVVRKLKLRSFSTDSSSERDPNEPSPDNEDVPIDEALVAKLKDIESETKSSGEHTNSLHDIGVDKIHVGFVGFAGSGKTTLIRSILGCPQASSKGNSAVDKRSSFRKSRSVHFSECVSSQLIPFYFRRLASIVLWEISYPFDVVHTLGDVTGRAERRQEKLSLFFVQQHLNKFCLLFVCVEEEPREEDVAFARVAHAHGKQVLFLATKGDARRGGEGIENEESMEAFIHRERIVFASKLASVAPELAELKCFFVCSTTIPWLVANSSDPSIVAFREMEMRSSVARIAEEGRRHTMGEGESSRPSTEDAPVEIHPMEEEALLHYIISFIDDFDMEA